MKWIKAIWVLLTIIPKMISASRHVESELAKMPRRPDTTQYTCHGCGGLFEFKTDEPHLHYTGHEGESYIKAVLCGQCDSKYNKEGKS